MAVVVLADLGHGKAARRALDQAHAQTLLLVNGEVVREAQMALLERDGQGLSVEANSDAVLLLLSGEPINELIVGHGPFVMNTEVEIATAMADFNAGRFGRISQAALS